MSVPLHKTFDTMTILRNPRGLCVGSYSGQLGMARSEASSNASPQHRRPVSIEFVATGQDKFPVLRLPRWNLAPFPPSTGKNRSWSWETLSLRFQGRDGEGEGMKEKLVWHVIKEFDPKLGIPKLARHDLRRSCARLCH